MPVFRGGGLLRPVRICTLLSGLLSLAGLFAPATGDMSIRVIGIAGYAGLSPIVGLLLALLFRRASARTLPSDGLTPEQGGT